ncbi:MAG: endolytic transglycosylase MltG [Methylophilaceae bacterium]|jgi:UPF0755 protein|nr:endolytic transglycosylase MltG [Methylophilaceae bacterium]
MKRFILFSLFIAVLGTVGFIAWLAHYAKTPLNINGSQTVVIKPQSSLSSIANQLVAQGVLAEAKPFSLLARSLRKASSLQAGEYKFDQAITPFQILLLLNEGKITKGKITLIEGKTFKEMRKQLALNSLTTNTIQDLSNASVMALVGAKQQHPEGLFFPDTYYIDSGTKDIVLLKRSYEVMTVKLATAWAGKEAGLPYNNSYEALIMASIIEKETGKASERPMIAGVFINRLRIGMRLQTDPTVIYGMGSQFKGNIRRKDLRTDTKYNTYTRGGLPPTPIAMPSLASIEAALHPAKTKALYFVGKGDGSHEFSNSLTQHNRAVAKYQLKR